MFKILLSILIFFGFVQEVYSAHCKTTHTTTYSTNKIENIIKEFRNSAISILIEKGIAIEEVDGKIKIYIDGMEHIINEKQTVENGNTIVEFDIKNAGKLKNFNAKVIYISLEKGTQSQVHFEGQYETDVDFSFFINPLDLIVKSQIIRIQKKTKLSLGEE